MAEGAFEQTSKKRGGSFATGPEQRCLAQRAICAGIRPTQQFCGFPRTITLCVASAWLRRRNSPVLLAAELPPATRARHRFDLAQSGSQVVDVPERLRRGPASLEHRLRDLGDSITHISNSHRPSLWLPRPMEDGGQVLPEIQTELGSLQVSLNRHHRRNKLRPSRRTR